MPAWDADLYLRFAEERTQPARDLVSRISLDSPRRIADLGCGPGNSTALLRARWPAAHVVGIDSSSEMISAARSAYPNGDWELADAASWIATEPCDLVFSNAALQWVPRHEEVFPHLIRQLAPGGALAVQMPAHFESPIHQLLLEIAELPAWRDRTRQAAEAIAVGRPAFYYDLLQPRVARLELWETEYDHILDGPNAIVTWIRGTGMRPFLDSLASDADRQQFETLLLEGVTRAYPRRCDGRVIFPFRRLFVLAYR